jgi:hypothetical protein
VEGAAVLNVGVVADANFVDVAAEYGVHPDAGVLAENDVADDLGGIVDVTGVGDLGSDAFVRADHMEIVTIPRREVRLQKSDCRSKTAGPLENWLQGIPERTWEKLAIYNPAVRVDP